MQKIFFLKNRLKNLCHIGYQHVEEAPEDREKTAFVPHVTQFQYRLVALGIRNSSATFRMLVSIVLQGQHGGFAWPTWTS